MTKGTRLVVVLVAAALIVLALIIGLILVGIGSSHDIM